jgi:hypothetical protein
MKREFEILKITRENILKTIQNFSDEQLVKIPTGFNNNILWNMGHVVSSTQKLTYGLAGIPIGISNELPIFFGKGSNPKEWKETPDIAEVKKYLTSLPFLLEEDYKNGVFEEIAKFKEYPTSYGYNITSIEDTIAFCNTHEALHLGVIMAIKKLV